VWVVGIYDILDKVLLCVTLKEFCVCGFLLGHF
jgi:hypothetical protein